MYEGDACYAKRLAESQLYSEMSRGEYCLFVTACGAVIVGVGCRLHASAGRVRAIQRELKVWYKVCDRIW